MKKIIALLLALTMIPGIVLAEDVTDEQLVKEDEIYELLTALHIINNYENCSDFYDIPYVSRGEYSNMVASVLTDEIPKMNSNCNLTDIAENENKDAIAYLWEKGIVAGRGDNEFKPELALTVEEAVIMAVRAAGYSYRTDKFLNGDYISAASKYGITDGITGNYKDEMKKEQLLVLLENLIEVEPSVVDMNKYGTDIQHEIKSDDTLIGFNRKIYTDKGVMTANEYTDELTPKISKKDYIEINGMVYESDSYQDKSDFLGMNVKVYYKDSNGDRTALFVRIQKGNNVTEIDSADIVSVSKDAVNYYSENSNLKKRKLSKTLKVIYNGIAYPDYTLDELKPRYGNLRLVDNDGDDVCDYALITSYELMWFDYYSALNKQIYNKMSTGIASLSVEEPEIERNFSIEKDGIITDRFELSANDVILVKRSADSENTLTRLYVSSETIDTVILSKRNDDDKIILVTDDGEFEMNPLTADAIADKDISMIDPQIGKQYKIYFDIFGKASAFEVSTKDEEQYGFLRKILYEEDELCAAKIFTIDGEWQRIEFADKVRFNNSTVKSEKIADLLAPGGTTAEQVIKYRLVDGKIKYIKTATKGDKAKEGAFITSGTEQFLYTEETKTIGDRYFFNNDAKIFVVPTDANAEDKDFSIEGPGILKNYGDKYTMEAYDADDFGFSGVFRIDIATDKLKSQKKSYVYYVVRKIFEQVNEDGEVEKVIECAGNGEDKVTFTESEKGVFEGLKNGDVIQIAKNSQNEVISVTKVVTEAERGSVYDAGITRMYGGNINIRGYVEDVDVNRYAFKLRINDKGAVYARNTSAPRVVFVDGKEVRVGTVRDISKNDFVAIHLNYAQVLDVVVFKN